MNINELAKKLQLPYVRDHYGQMIDEAMRSKPDYTTFG